MGSSPLELSALNCTVTPLVVLRKDSSGPLQTFLTLACRMHPQGQANHLALWFSTLICSHLWETRQFLRTLYTACLEHTFQVSLYFLQVHPNIPPLSYQSVESRSNSFWVSSVWFPLKSYFLQKCGRVVASQEMSHPHCSLNTTISQSIGVTSPSVPMQNIIPPNHRSSRCWGVIEEAYQQTSGEIIYQLRPEFHTKLAQPRERRIECSKQTEQQVGRLPDKRKFSQKTLGQSRRLQNPRSGVNQLLRVVEESLCELM